MKHAIAAVPPLGSPRPYATHYHYGRVHDLLPTKVGHCASRKGAVIAAVRRLASIDHDIDKSQFFYVEIFDDLGVCCNVVERRGDVVAVKGYY